MNYVYILECGDKSYYTGWTNDLLKRVQAHQDGKGAKYTKGRSPITLVYFETLDSKSQALKREYEIKQLSRVKKQQLIQKMGMHRITAEMLLHKCTLE